MPTLTQSSVLVDPREAGSKPPYEFVFLASNDARYITGSVVDVTGGEQVP